MSDMPVWEFTLLLDRHVSDDEFDRLAELGCEEGVIDHPDGTGSIDVLGRPGETLLGTIAEVVGLIRSVGGPEVVGVDTELPDPVSLIEISARLDGVRTAESLRLLALGKRGPGGFPRPVGGGKTKLYSYAEVTAWLRDVMGDEIPPVWPDLALANQALKVAAWARRTDHLADVQRLVA